MDPRHRADDTLARARARGAFVVTPDDATSPMDAASTVQIPRTMLAGGGQRADSNTEMILSSEHGGQQWPTHDQTSWPPRPKPPETLWPRTPDAQHAPEPWPPDPQDTPATGFPASDPRQTPEVTFGPQGSTPPHFGPRGTRPDPYTEQGGYEWGGNGRDEWGDGYSGTSPHWR